MVRGARESQSESDSQASGTVASRNMAAKYTLQAKRRVIFEALSSFDINKMKSILQRIELRDSVENLPKLWDDEGSNLLHRAAYDNTFRIVEYLINYYKLRLGQFLKQEAVERCKKQNYEQLSSAEKSKLKQELKKRVADWINTPAKTEQGYYPLHFASFHGNVQMIKLLMRNRANYKVRTNEGINMLHVAAQGDNAFSLTYFRSKGLSIMSVDREKSTPLHWACVAGSDTAIYYLQSWGVDVNARDFLDYTPLHLAVRYVSRFPSTRAIKELLIKGADRDAQEKNGLMPIDLCDSVED